MSLSEKLWKETYLYVSDKPIDELRSDIDALLQRTRGWRFDVNLTGSFKGGNAFHLTPKRSFAVFSGTDQNISHLNGELFEQGNKTLVRVTVRPNLVTVIGVILVPLLVFASMFADSAKNNDRMIALATGILFPTFFYYIGIRYPKNAIRNRFARVFDLRLAVDERLASPDIHP